MPSASELVTQRNAAGTRYTAAIVELREWLRISRRSSAATILAGSIKGRTRIAFFMVFQPRPRFGDRLARVAKITGELLLQGIGQELLLALRRMHFARLDFGALGGELLGGVLRHSP